MDYQWNLLRFEFRLKGVDMVSFDPEKAISGVVLPVPGRYYFKSAKFIPDFDYAGSQEPQTAAQFVLISDKGEEFELNITVGKNDKLWPSPDGKTLLPMNGNINKSSNFYHFMERAINIGGFPKTRLSTDIGATFVGLSADFDGYKVAGRERALSVPVKFYMNEPPPPPPFVGTAASKPPVPSLSSQPTVSSLTPTAPQVGSSDFNVAIECLKLAQQVAVNNMPKTKQSINQLVISSPGLTDGQRLAMMNHVFSVEFQGMLQQQGISLT